MLSLDNDGIFGVKTEAAVIAFQKSHNLTPDGIVGAKTWAALGVSSSELPNNSDDIKIVDAPIKIHIKRFPNRPLKYIAIHYTAGTTSKAGSAMAVRNAFNNPKSRDASADFAVDDATIVKINPDIRNYYCWAVGDRKSSTKGGRLYGTAYNSNTISIEICSNLDKKLSEEERKVACKNINHTCWYYTAAALENARRLVRYLMGKYNIPKERVVRHYDITGKVCPAIVGWNDEEIRDIYGKKVGKKSTSASWEAFWQSI